MLALARTYSSSSRPSPHGSLTLYCMQNYVNLIVGSKNPGRNWLNAEDAKKHCTAGASVWEQYSTDGGVDPHVVLVAIGTEPTVEVIMAATILKKDMPNLRVRVVNVTDLMCLGVCSLLFPCVQFAVSDDPASIYSPKVPTPTHSTPLDSHPSSLPRLPSSSPSMATPPPSGLSSTGAPSGRASPLSAPSRASCIWGTKNRGARRRRGRC